MDIHNYRKRVDTMKVTTKNVPIRIIIFLVIILGIFLLTDIFIKINLNDFSASPLDQAVQWFDKNYESAKCRTYEGGLDGIRDRISRLSEICPSILNATHVFQYDNCKQCGDKPFICVQSARSIIFTDEKTILTIFKPPNEGFRLDNIKEGLLIYCNR